EAPASHAVRAPHACNQSNIVNAGYGAVTIVFATGKRNLELAWQIVKIRMSQQKARHAECVGRYVECFPGANPRQRAGSDVAYRVTAGLPGSEAGIGEQPHHRGDILQPDEVELNVLARGQMATSGRVGIGDVRQHAQLVAIQHARRDLNAHHLDSRLTLAVNAMLQPERAKLFFRDFAAAELADALLKDGDLVSNRFAAVPPLDACQPFRCCLRHRLTPKSKKPTRQFVGEWASI